MLSAVPLLWPCALVVSGHLQSAEGTDGDGAEPPAEALPFALESVGEVWLLGLALTLSSVVLCAKAEPNAPMTAAAVRLAASCFTLMCSPVSVVGETIVLVASAVPMSGRYNPHMSEHKRPHDMGGDEDAGPIDTVDHGMKFWEKQANALRNTLTSRKILRLDELRRAAEDLGERYYQLEYFERTTHALRQVLVEKGYFTEAELAAKMQEVRKRYES